MTWTGQGQASRVVLVLFSHTWSAQYQAQFETEYIKHATLILSHIWNTKYKANDFFLVISNKLYHTILSHIYEARNIISSHPHETHNIKQNMKHADNSKKLLRYAMCTNNIKPLMTSTRAFPSFRFWRFGSPLAMRDQILPSKTTVKGFENSRLPHQWGRRIQVLSYQFGSCLTFY